MLSAYPQLQIMQQIGRTYRLMLSAFGANVGHPMPRWRILFTLHQKGDVSQKDLIAELRMDPAALTRQLKSIEQLGWIERHSDPVDNRLTNVALTEEGKEVVRTTLPRRADFIDKAFSDFSLDQMETLCGLLDTLELRLRNEAGHGASTDALSGK